MTDITFSNRSQVAGGRKNARWFGGRELVALLVGALIYGGLIWFTSFAGLDDPALKFTLRPGIVVPIILGFVYGPVVGFGVGFIGNILGDLFTWQAAWGTYYPYWQWAVGNGVMGMIPGFYALYRRQYHSWTDQIIALIMALVGVAAGMALAGYSTIWVCSPEVKGLSCSKLGWTFDEVTPVVLNFIRVNAINALILTPILLFNVARLDLRSTDWLGSGLLRRLLIAIVVSAALPIAILGGFLVEQFTGQQADPATLGVKIIGTIVVSLLFTVANAALVAQTMSGPLLRLTRAAQAMESGALSEQQVAQLQGIEGSDEIAQLSRRFGQMAGEVIKREHQLRQRVAELQIMVDESKKYEQVSEIVETDFFRELQNKANVMRERKSGKPAEAAGSDGAPTTASGTTAGQKEAAKTSEPK